MRIVLYLLFSLVIFLSFSTCQADVPMVHSNQTVKVYFDIDTSIWLPRSEADFLAVSNTLVAEASKVSEEELLGVYGKTTNIQDYPYMLVVHKTSPEPMPTMAAIQEQLGEGFVTIQQAMEKSKLGFGSVVNTLPSGQFLFDMEKSMMLVSSNDASSGKKIEVRIASFLRGRNSVSVLASYEAGTATEIMPEFERIVNAFQWAAE